jgi:glutamate-ammonia-ligase adenylyltransferase
MRGEDPDPLGESWAGLFFAANEPAGSPASVAVEECGMSDRKPPALADWLAARLAAMQSALGSTLEQLQPAMFDELLLASDFAQHVLLTQPDAVHALGSQSPPMPPVLDAAHSQEWPALVRRWRALSSLRLIWRDVAGLDSVEQTLAGASELAETALRVALAAVESSIAMNHGAIRRDDGSPQSLTVLALGKLGGGELNFSSDVDLIFAYAQAGTSDGARPLDADAYYARIGQRLIALLGETTPDGFSHRVDMRLRPFGASGRLALSYAAMEQYYQNEGRDWERYAWVKARAVAGDIDGGERLLQALRPFVYRRYLDYTALDGLREMKALIAAEVERRELADDLKLGPGGIREIEFLAQALQLIRGGREPALRQRALLPALSALAAAGHLPIDTARRLADAYRFLRRLENRVQMFADQQLHALPEDAFVRLRMAVALDFPDWAALRIELDRHRTLVAEEFERLLASRKHAPATGDLAEYWRALGEEGVAEFDTGVLAAAGFIRIDALHVALRDFARGSALRTLSARARVRLDRILPKLLQAAAASAAPDLALTRLLVLLQAIARRGSYLALLDEQPAALQRLVQICASSALLAERVAAHPLLLDEMLDARAAAAAPTRASLAFERDRVLDAAGADSTNADSTNADAEAQLHALAEFRQSVSFRIGLALLNERQDAIATARQLAWLAEAVLDGALRIAHGEIARRADGDAAQAGLALIGYGSLGGEELGFGSDLDLVFLHAGARAEEDSGDAARRQARLAQKLVSLLGTTTPAGRLYEVDVRLRPDGAKGLLVSSVDSFADYQRSRAWTWERQALLRARGICGDARTLAAFERVRAETLLQSRDAATLRSEVIAMRLRMRGELDRSRSQAGDVVFDLKQGEGGLVDLEFLLQWAALAHADAMPELLDARATPESIASLAEHGLLDSDQAAALRNAHALLLRRSLDCTLDGRPRLMVEDSGIAGARSAIRTACRAHGLEFG